MYLANEKLFSPKQLTAPRTMNYSDDNEANTTHP